MVTLQLLLAAGRFPGKGLLNFWQRVPLRSPSDGEDSKLTWVLLTPTVEFSAVQQLPSGRLQFIQFVGITEQEAEFARTHSSGELLKLLVAIRASSVTDPARCNILSA
jgi:hypothetical protein